jgi:hypothetical protein
MTAPVHNPAQNANARSTLFWVTPKGAKFALIALHVAALLAVLIELVRPFPEDAHAVERVHRLDFLASYAVYGFVSCVILVLLGLVLRRLIMRDENYYHDNR